MAENTSGSSTKQLKKVLGFWDLMGVSVGQIIGAGIMTVMGAAIAMTGRSVPFAFLLAAILTVCVYLSLVIIAGTVRVRGGMYTMVAMLAGKNFAGVNTIIYIFSNVSISMYALAFASYLTSLMGFGNEKIIALVILTLFFGLNCLGIDKFAKVQNLIVSLLVVSLAIFCAFGLPHIDSNYFAPETFMTSGVMGFLQASALLTFALGGANAIVNLSAECKNPTRDLPMAMIISTMAVAVVYGVIAFVAAGVLPVEQVAGQNLTLVAQEVLSGPLYIFFIVCGAGFALISTLNAQFAWCPKPVMQACDDGWLPAGLAKLSKWNTPIIILSIIYGIGVICIISDLSIAILGNMAVIANGTISLLICAAVWRLPKICPEAWEVSKFKCSKTALMVIAVVGSLASVVNIYLNATTLTPMLLVLNVVVIIGSFVFAFVRGKKVNMEISYENA